MADLVWSDPDPDKEDFAISARWVGHLVDVNFIRHNLTYSLMNVEELVIPLAVISYSDFWTQTTCPIS